MSPLKRLKTYSYGLWLLAMLGCGGQRDASPSSVAGTADASTFSVAARATPASPASTQYPATLRTAAAALSTLEGLDGSARSRLTLQHPSGFYTVPRASAPDAPLTVQALRVRIPERADQAMRLLSPRHPDAWIDVRALDVDSVASSVERDAVVHTEVSHSVDMVRSATPGGVQEWRILHDSTASHSLRWSIDTGPAIAQMRIREGMIEAVDAAGYVHVVAPPLWAVDAMGRRRTLTSTIARDGGRWVLRASVPDDLVAPVAVDPIWSAAAPLLEAINGPIAAQVLADGRVFALFSGGTMAQVYDAAKNMWASFPLPSGASGNIGPLSWETSPGVVLAVSNSGPSYQLNLSTGAWTAKSQAPSYTDVTPAPFYNMTPLKLSGGKFVAVSGRGCPGASCTATLPSAQYIIYDPGADTYTPGSFSPPGPTNSRYDIYPIGLAVLPGDRILSLPRMDSAGSAVSNTLVYTAGSDSWLVGRTIDATCVPDTSWSLKSADAAVMLDTHRMLVLSMAPTGSKCISGASSSGLIYDVTSDAWSGVGGSARFRWNGIATPYATGVLHIGGTLNASGPASYTTLVDYFDSIANTFRPLASALTARSEGQALQLQDGSVLVLGGADNTYTALATVDRLSAFVAGATCAVATDCPTGACVDGVCCNTACNTACQACNLPGLVGTCSPVDSAVDPRALCTGGTCGNFCKLGACAPAPSSTACGATTCSGNMLSSSGFCSGTDSTCRPSTAPVACANGLNCDVGGKTCKSKCSSDGDCAVGTNHCDLASGACIGAAMDAGAEVAVDAGADLGVLTDAAAPLPATPVVMGTYQHCAKDSDCSTMHCVEGVCCNTACTDECHSCALINSPGICTLEPAGVDLQNHCGASTTCTGTCGGDGHCIGAGAGSMCEKNVCTGATTGIGPAYCAGPGAACSNAAVTAFDCTPYVCAPAFGACITSCASTADCANGYTCDIPSKTCTADVPASKSGCSLSGAPQRDSASSAAYGLAVAAVAVIRRKSRRRGASLEG